MKKAEEPPPTPVRRRGGESKSLDLATLALFPPGKAVWIYDDVCVLCSAAVQRTIRHDRQARIVFASAQGPIGQAVYRALGMPTDRFETFLFVADGRVHLRSDGVIAIARVLGWRAAGVARLVPRAVRDAAYGVVARNRYQWFGKRETCLVPDAAVRARFLD